MFAGHAKTKREIVNVVHIGEFTLSKRLHEFVTTPAGGLKKQEFLEHAKQIEEEQEEALKLIEGEAAPEGLVGGCAHLANGANHFKNGLCRECYGKFVKSYGGLYNGVNPPSFVKNREKENKCLEIMENGEFSEEDEHLDNASEHSLEEDREEQEELEEKITTSKMKKDASTGRKQSFDSATVLAAESYVKGFDAAISKAEQEEAKKRRGSMSAAIAVASAFALEEAAAAVGEERGMMTLAHGGSSLPLSTVGDFETQQEHHDHEAGEMEDDHLSDISDSEISMYIAVEEEVKCKEEIWNMMNQDWVEKQEAKKEALEASLKAQEEQRKAMEEAAAAGVQYKRGRGRPLGSKSKPKAISSLPPAETPQEAAMRIIDDKKLSSKINYNVLADLFSHDPGSDGFKPERKGPPKFHEGSLKKTDTATAQVNNGANTSETNYIEGERADGIDVQGTSAKFKPSNEVDKSGPQTTKRKRYQRLESLSGNVLSSLSSLNQVPKKPAAKPKGILASRPKSTPRKTEQ